ncbi:MAG: hypothetical protein SGARI_001487, partial [Bacillariaceae sp.]
MSIAVKRHEAKPDPEVEEAEQKVEESPTMEEDDESTYVALEKDGRGHTACQGVPNLMLAVEGVMDSFEDVVEDQKWFRFLKKKYDSFNHLEDDGTVHTIMFCDTKDEDGTINTFTSRTITIPGHIKENLHEDEESVEDEASIEEEERTVEEEEKKDDHSEFFVKVVSTHQVADTDYDYDYVEDEVSKITFHAADEEAEDDDDDQDEEESVHTENEDEGVEVEDDEITVYSDVDEEVPDDEIESAEEPVPEADEESKEPSVEIDGDGTALTEDQPTNDIPRIRSKASVKREKVEAEALLSDILFAPAHEEKEMDGTANTDRARFDAISPSPSSFGLEMPAALAPFASSFSGPPRDRSSGTEESHGSRNTFNTAETTLEGRRVDDPEETGGDIEVVGYKQKTRLGFLRFWKSKKGKKPKAPKRNVFSRQKKQTKVKAVPPKATPLPPRPVPKARSQTKPMFRRAVKEKPLPKTTVIVTR